MKLFILLYFFLQTGNIFAGEIFLSPAVYKTDIFPLIEEHIKPPLGYIRVNVVPGSFEEYLRQLPVVDGLSDVKDYKNRQRVAANDSALAAVIPVDIFGKKLWQCMDIILVFYADYLLQNQKQDQIKFPLPDGTILSWNDWMKGNRPTFQGLNFKIFNKASPDSSAKNYERYLNCIFEYSGTQTFFYNYPQVQINDFKPGDFIVKKGSKGHAVLIMDLATNEDGEKIVLIGQGDTPACQFYLLKNKQGSPWFKITDKSTYPDLPIRKKMYWSGLRRFPALK